MDAQNREPATRACYATSLRKASRRLTQFYDDALAPAGLRSTQFAILGELAGADPGPVTLNQLARALVLDRSGLGHSLRPLQRDGLIRLDKGTNDRRSTHVVLTPDGRRRYKRAFPRWQQAQDRVAAIVGQSAANELRSQLIDIAADDRLR
jgi:DNA-binding MarR family transcriptional regulator